MTRIDKLVQDRLLTLLRRDRHLVLERVVELVGEVLERNARAYDRLGKYPEAIALRESSIDILDVVERELGRDEVMRCG